MDSLRMFRIPIGSYGIEILVKARNQNEAISKAKKEFLIAWGDELELEVDECYEVER